MIVRFRTALSILCMSFALYLVLRMLLRGVDADHPAFVIAAAVLYTVTITVALVVPPIRTADPREARMPGWAVALSVGCGAALPWLVVASRPSSHSTWYFGTVGLLMTVLVARRRTLWAWISVAVLTLSTTIILTLPVALAWGLVGAVLWVSVAQVVMYFTDRAYRDTIELERLQHAAQRLQQSQSLRGRERRERIQHALDVAGPILARVIAANGDLDGDERQRAWRAEGALRDELRGRALLDAQVRGAVAELRERGTTVTVLDEGGLDDLPDGALRAVRAELASVLEGVSAERVIVRTATDPRVAVTIVGRGDDDDVSLWYEISRP
ncbi:MAG: hypothetical protein QM607_00530 [Microbacterium sp.]